VAFLVRFGICDYGGLLECGAVGCKLSGRYVNSEQISRPSHVFLLLVISTDTQLVKIAKVF